MGSFHCKHVVLSYQNLRFCVTFHQFLDVERYQKQAHPCLSSVTYGWADKKQTNNKTAEDAM